MQVRGKQLTKNYLHVFFKKSRKSVGDFKIYTIFAPRIKDGSLNNC